MMTKPMSHSKSSHAETLSLQQCAYYFNLPIQQATVKLKVSRPTISKLLRKHGISRWPYRKLSTKLNVHLGKLQNWNESKAMAILATLKEEKLQYNKDIVKDSDDDENTRNNVCGPTSHRDSNESPISSSSIACQDLNNVISTMCANKSRINIKENNIGSSLKQSEHVCSISTTPLSTNSPQNCENIINNNNNYSTPKNSLNSFDSCLSFPVLDPPFPPQFSLLPAVSYDVKPSAISPISETELDISHCLSDKQPVISLRSIESRDYFNHGTNHSFELQNQYHQGCQHSPCMVVTPSAQEKGTRVSTDEVLQRLTDHSGNECDNELGNQSVVNINGNECNTELRKFSDFDAYIDISKSLISPITGYSVFDFDVDRNDTIFSAHEDHNAVVGWDAPFLSSSAPIIDRQLQ